MSTFEINQIVIYDPNIINLPPIEKRIHNIGIIREITKNNALVFFPHENGYIKVALKNLIKAPSNVELPIATKSEKMAKIEYNMFNVNNLRIFKNNQQE